MEAYGQSKGILGSSPEFLHGTELHEGDAGILGLDLEDAEYGRVGVILVHALGDHELLHVILIGNITATNRSDIWHEQKNRSVCSLSMPPDHIERRVVLLAIKELAANSTQPSEFCGETPNTF